MDRIKEGRFAPFYDLFFDAVLKPIHLKNLEIISKYHCEKIIDLGCGTGAQCRVLSNHGFEVVGIDHSEKMLQVAKNKKLNKTTFIHGDITEHIVLDQTFDCAIITLVLHPNDQKTITSIIKEAKKITKQDGIIIITDYNHGRHTTGKLATMVIKCIESLAMPSHRSNFFKFMKRGAMQTILSEHAYRVLESFSFYGNSLNMLVVT